MEGHPELLNARVPVNKAIGVCCTPSQQFLISRDVIHRRPLSVWKSLLKIIGEATPQSLNSIAYSTSGQQEVCHVGEPDYKNLYAYYKLMQHGDSLPGPETPNIAVRGESETNPGIGKHTQGTVGHVIRVHVSLRSIQVELWSI